VGERLLALVADARAAGVDPEQALRDAVRRLAARVRAAESE
jgi:XTP/dITP diphosphohydrolase